MVFAKELYPTFEEARDTTVESGSITEALEEFLYVVDRWESEDIRQEAAITLGAKIRMEFERQKNRAKDRDPEEIGA